MAKTYCFDSQMTIERTFNFGNANDEIKHEPMFFSADLKYAHENGGHITRSFVEALASHFNNDHELLSKMVFDSRSHMLMKGWFPCIPGFHHDDVERKTRKDGQPNYDNPIYRAQHCLGLVNGDICPTEFATGIARFPIPKEDQVAYKIWHPLVEKAIRNGKLDSVSAPSDKLVFFDDRTWHQGTKAVADGWRWFGRASWNTDRPIRNEIRKQVQVYLEFPMEGW